MKNKNWFQKKYVTLSFAGIAFLSGFLFLNITELTSNVVNVNFIDSNFNPLTFTGILLLICATVLLAYSSRKRK